jgi:NTE family protein
MASNNKRPSKQRALVLQGGGVLGAYEAGVLYVLCKRLHRNKANDCRPLFDIVAGTSIAQ